MGLLIDSADWTPLRATRRASGSVPVAAPASYRVIAEPSSVHRTLLTKFPTKQ
jgi:hypothetical protein